MSTETLGKTYLEQYYSDESLVGGIPGRRHNVMRQALYYSDAAFTLRNERPDGVNPFLCIDIAVENYFLGKMNNAKYICSRNT